MKFVLATCAIAALTVSASGASAGVVTFSNDAAFQGYEAAGNFAKTFGGNVRWGNGGASGDWEYAIVNAGDMPIGAVANTAWAGTNTHTVTFTYDGAGSAGLDLAGIGSLTRTVPAGVTSLFARVRDSATPFSSLTLIEVDLKSNGAGVDYTFAALTGDADAEYWGIEDANLAQGFTLTATATLSGPRTNGSDPMYQFKAGIPSPGAAALLGALGLLASRRRR